ncbi:hypothetical protein [Histidinibacterium lentulum]|uniref:hypothetical protein n=1 Tax=Histidinibacterium lentulum TaxID=2480588 RepID=UPI000F4BE20D|nr:hypothetical protein [Histidinibacterium lentulum]
MLAFLEEVWRFEYALLPCAIAYLVFDLPILYRRITRRLYVPIYFAFFPYGYSDELCARYFDEDHYHIVGGPFKDSEVKNARIRIIWISVISLILTMTISPFLTAIFSFLFLSDAQNTQFLYTLAIVKGALLIWSLYDLRWTYTVTSVVPISYIAFIYSCYWIAILTFYSRSLAWIADKHSVGGMTEVFNGILDFIIFEIGIGILFVAVLGFLIPWRLTYGTARPVADTNND